MGLVFQMFFPLLGKVKWWNNLILLFKWPWWYCLGLMWYSQLISGPVKPQKPERPAQSNVPWEFLPLYMSWVEEASSALIVSPACREGCGQVFSGPAKPQWGFWPRSSSCFCATAQIGIISVETMWRPYSLSRLDWGIREPQNSGIKQVWLVKSTSFMPSWATIC